MGKLTAVLAGAALVALSWTAAAQPPGYTPRDDFGGSRVPAAPGAKEARIALAWGDQLKPPSQYLRAVINLKEAMARWTQTPVSVERQFRIGTSDIMDLPIVFILADEPFHLSETEKKNLREYIAKGGMIVADDAGADWPGGKAGASLRQMIKEISGGKQLEPIPDSHAIYNSPMAIGGPPTGIDRALTTVGRTFDPAGNPIEKKAWADDAKALEGVFINGRLAVLYSPKGYTKRWNTAGENDDSQLRFGVNLIMYAINRR